MRGEREGLRGETREASLVTRNSKREERKVTFIHEMLCGISFDDLYDLMRHLHTHTHTDDFQREREEVSHQQPQPLVWQF